MSSSVWCQPRARGAPTWGFKHSASCFTFAFGTEVVAISAGSLVCEGQTLALLEIEVPSLLAGGSRADHLLQYAHINGSCELGMMRNEESEVMKDTHE
jgi:hypothetical protein